LFGRVQSSPVFVCKKRKWTWFFKKFISDNMQKRSFLFSTEINLCNCIAPNNTQDTPEKKKQKRMEYKYITVETTDRLSFDVTGEKNAYAEIKTSDLIVDKGAQRTSVLLSFQSSHALLLESSPEEKTKTIVHAPGNNIDAVSTSYNNTALFAKEANVYQPEGTLLGLVNEDEYEHIFGIGYGFLAQKKGSAFYLRDREDFELADIDLSKYKNSFLQHHWVDDRTVFLCFLSTPDPNTQQTANIYQLTRNEYNVWRILRAFSDIECGNSVKKPSQFEIGKGHFAWVQAHNIRVFDLFYNSTSSIFLRNEHDPTARPEESNDSHIEAICIDNARDAIASIESKSESVYITGIYTKTTLFRVVLYSRARHLDSVLFLKFNDAELYAGCIIKKGNTHTLRVTTCDTSNARIDSVMQRVDYFSHQYQDIFSRDLRTFTVKIAWDNEHLVLLKMVYRPFIEAGNVRSVIPVGEKDSEFLMPSIHGSLVSVWTDYTKEKAPAFDNNAFEVHVRELARGSLVPGLAVLKEAVLVQDKNQDTLHSILVFASKNHVPFRDVFESDKKEDAMLIDRSVFYMQKPLFMYDYYLALRSVLSATVDMLALGIKYRLTSDCFAFDSLTNRVSVYKGLPIGRDGKILSRDAYEIIVNGKYKAEFSNQKELLRHLEAENYTRALHEVNRLLGEYAKKYTNQMPHYLNRDFVNDDVTEMQTHEILSQSDNEEKSEDDDDIVNQMLVDSPSGQSGEMAENLYSVAVDNYKFFAPVVIKTASSEHEYVSACMNALASSPGVQYAIRALEENNALDKKASVLKNAVYEIHEKNDQLTLSKEVQKIAESENMESTQSMSNILDSLFPSSREEHNPFRFVIQEDTYFLQPRGGRYPSLGKIEGVSEYIRKTTEMKPESYHTIFLVENSSETSDLQIIMDKETAYTSRKITSNKEFPDISNSLVKYSFHGTLPKLFVIYVDRFPDQKGGKIKLSNPIVPSQYLSLTATKDDGTHSMQYALYGVISHPGKKVNATEHVCHVQRRVSGGRLQWYRFDNEKCEKVNYDTVSRETISSGCVFLYEQCTN
jgi:hypothetical protein